MLENTRYHPGEEANDPELARALASLADIYVNDAFSAAHRAHASTEGVARHLPSHAGRLMQAELDALTLALENPERPVGAVVGGAKISTKLDLLGNIVGRVDVLIIGGAMANTFLAARGVPVGRSLQEADMHDTARAITAQAEARGCRILLPTDAVVAREFKAGAPSEPVPIDAVPADAMILDAGPLTVAHLAEEVARLRTLVWNGPLGAFEIAPFDVGTSTLARAVAALTKVRQPALGGRRRRHRVRPAPRRGGGRVLLRVQRRRRVPGMAGRQDAARDPGAAVPARDRPAGLIRGAVNHPFIMTRPDLARHDRQHLLRRLFRHHGSTHAGSTHAGSIEAGCAQAGGRHWHVRSRHRRREARRVDGARPGTRDARRRAPARQPARPPGLRQGTFRITSCFNRLPCADFG